MIDFKVGQKVGLDLEDSHSYAYGRVLAVTETEYAISGATARFGSTAAADAGHVIWVLKGDCWRDDD